MEIEWDDSENDYHCHLISITNRWKNKKNNDNIKKKYKNKKKSRWSEKDERKIEENFLSSQHKANSSLCWFYAWKSIKKIWKKAKTFESFIFSPSSSLTLSSSSFGIGNFHHLFVVCCRWKIFSFFLWIKMRVKRGRGDNISFS